MRCLPFSIGLKKKLLNKFVPYVLDVKTVPNELVGKLLCNYKTAILCNPYVYIHWFPYFAGVLYEEHVQKYIESNVNIGDTVIDIGCNVGQISAIASENVGPSGKVISFEPNPALVDKLKEHFTSEKVSNVTVVPHALGQSESTLTLNVDLNNTGMGTLQNRQAGQLGDSQTSTFEVDVKVGGEFFDSIELHNNVFLKCDVEGFEIEVLKGLTKTLKHKISHAIIEVTPEWIDGSQGTGELFNIMTEAGFLAYEIQKNGVRGKQLVPELVKKQTDVLFIAQE